MQLRLLSATSDGRSMSAITGCSFNGNIQPLPKQSSRAEHQIQFSDFTSLNYIQNDVLWQIKLFASS